MVIYLMKYEPQPRPQRSALDCSSSNSFASYSFRTLASHLKATVSSNSFEIKHFRTLCKIPGIGYPPLANRHRSTISPTSPKPLSSFNSFTFNGFQTLSHNGRPQPMCFHTFPDSFHRDGGVYPLRPSSPNARRTPKFLRRRVHAPSSAVYFSNRKWMVTVT
jgi:hypothetical protein